MKLRSLVAVGILTLLMVPYQNCALQQSEGRKQLEKFVGASSSKNYGCLPYLAASEADAIFEGQFNTQSYILNGTGVKSCQVIAANENGGAGVASCQLIPDNALKNVTPSTAASTLSITAKDNKVYYYVAATSTFSEQNMGALTPPTGEEKYFGIAEDDTDDVKFMFFNAEHGLYCTFVLDSTRFNELKESVSKRGSKLQHKISSNCTGGKCGL